MFGFLLEILKVIPVIVPAILELMRLKKKPEPPPLDPPPPVEPPPPPPVEIPKVELGYYYVDSKYGSFYKKVKDYAPIYRICIQEFKTSEISYDEAKKKFRETLKAANPAKLVLAIDSKNENIKDVISEVVNAGYWDEVIAVELADEPGWDAGTAAMLFRKYKDLLRDLDISIPKYGAGVVETKKNILETKGWEVLDWVGVEAYVTAPGDTAEVNREVLFKDLDSMLAVLKDKPYVLIPQGYDRNGNWKNIKTLVQLQKDILNYPRQDNMLPFEMIFAYGRPGGSKDHPELAAVHKEWVTGEKVEVTKDPKLYIPWADREQWAFKIEYCYSVWRGDRDLSYLVSNPVIAKEFKINLDEVLTDIGLMQDFHSRQDELRLRILNDRHPDYPDRCRVRKLKVEEFLTEAKEINNRYSSYIQHFIDGGVSFGKDFDSIKGYIEWRKKRG